MVTWSKDGQVISADNFKARTDVKTLPEKKKVMKTENWSKKKSVGIFLVDAQLNPPQVLKDSRITVNHLPNRGVSLSSIFTNPIHLYSW